MQKYFCLILGATGMTLLFGTFSVWMIVVMWVVFVVFGIVQLVTRD